MISPSPVRTDRIDKVREYAAVPSIMTYVIVEPVTVGLTVLSRERPGAPWLATTLADGNVLALPHSSIEVPVDELYDGVNLS